MDRKPRLKIDTGGMPRSTQEPPVPPPITPWGGESETPYDWAADRYGTPREPVPVEERSENFSFENLFPESPLLAKNQPGYGIPSPEEMAFRRAQANIGRGPAYEPEERVEPEDPFLAFLSQFQGQTSGGGGMAAPDYSQYRQALTDQAGQINAQIQAMYNALGDEAAANVGRIEDIYGGAQAGIGDVYESAAANTADAYGSSQQQAADQLARLGIEAAAPAVVNPMALSQAEALSGLEAGRAGGEAATERYGASAGGFGSQMAQVAQQQGTEMNAAILAALQNRLNESLLMEEQGRQAAASSGGGGQSAVDSAMDYLRLQEMFNAPAMAQQELEFEAAQIAADNTLSERDKLIELSLQFERDRGLDPLAAQEEAAIYLENANRAMGIS